MSLTNRRRVLRSIIVLAALASPLVIWAADRAQLHEGGAAIDVQFSEAPKPPVREALIGWIEKAARAVITYHGQFPVKRVTIKVTLVDEDGPGNGTTYGWNGALIEVTAGRASTPADFADDWLMTHEMLHLGFPSVDEKHHWIEEGISTYVEPVARARAGQTTPENVWADFVRDMPQGEPETGDRGLDFTHTWGRTYWGGAMFCLLADVEIRKRTNNHMGLEHALRAIVKAGGTIEQDWKLSRATEVGDHATGVPVLRELYDKMRAAPVPIDLNGLWKQLGIERRGSGVAFNNSAPLAAIRTAITKRAAAP